MKKEISIDTNNWIGGRNGKIIGTLIALVAAVAIAYNVGHSDGVKRGYAAGDKAGFERGSSAGVEVGYWEGRYDGCLWVFDAVERPYVVGEGNPFTTWYYLMDIGSIYLDKNNCEIPDDHGDAPKLDVPYTPFTTISDTTVN